MKLCDFGLSRSKLHTTITWANRSPVGTFAYIATEVLVGYPVKSKMLAQLFSDVWSMSCVAVEWVTGNFPWKYTEKQDLKREIKAKQKQQQLPDELCNVPDSVRRILEEGLVYDYRKRPSAKDMKLLVWL